MISGGCSLGNDFAAVNAGARTDIDHVIGGQNGVFVMLDHNDRVAEIAQMLERFQKPGVVALMKTDGRFVENIENARQAGADL